MVALRRLQVPQRRLDGAEGGKTAPHRQARVPVHAARQRERLERDFPGFLVGALLQERAGEEIEGGGELRAAAARGRGAVQLQRAAQVLLRRLQQSEDLVELSDDPQHLRVQLRLRSQLALDPLRAPIQQLAGGDLLAARFGRVVHLEDADQELLDRLGPGGLPPCLAGLPQRSHHASQDREEDQRGGGDPDTVPRDELPRAVAQRVLARQNRQPARDGARDPAPAPRGRDSAAPAPS